MRVMPRTVFTGENIIGGVEDHARVGFAGRARHISGADGVDREGERWVQLTIVHAVERGGVDHPVRPVLAYDTRDANPIRDVDFRVRESDGIAAEGPHEILPKLTRRPDDQCLHAGTPASTVSLSQRILKKRGSLSGSNPKSPRSSASQMVTTASAAPRSALNPRVRWIFSPLT